jgi:hypothetical protein
MRAALRRVGGGGGRHDAGDAAAFDDELGFAGANRDLIVFHEHDLADDSAGGDDLVALLDVLDLFLVLLALLLLGAQEDEVEDGEDQSIQDEGLVETRSRGRGGLEQRGN